MMIDMIITIKITIDSIVNTVRIVDEYSPYLGDDNLINNLRNAPTIAVGKLRSINIKRVDAFTILRIIRLRLFM